MLKLSATIDLLYDKPPELQLGERKRGSVSLSMNVGYLYIYVYILERENWLGCVSLSRKCKERKDFEV